MRILVDLLISQPSDQIVLIFYFLIQKEDSQMKQAEKQNRNTHSLHFKQKDSATLNKKYILPVASGSRNALNGCSLHQKATHTAASLHPSQKTHQHPSSRNDSHSHFNKNDPLWKNKPIEESSTEKYVPFKNDDRIKEIFGSYRDYIANKSRELGRPSVECIPFMLKADRVKDLSATSGILTLENSINKKTNFTISVKELRKRNKKQVRNDTMNCRVVNLFESIERKIKPIHQQDASNAQIKNISLKDYLTKISQSLGKVVESQHIEKELLSRQKEGAIFEAKHCEEGSNLPELAQAKLNAQFIQTEMPFRELRKSKKQHSNAKTKQFQLKPWSTREIATDI